MKASNLFPSTFVGLALVGLVFFSACEKYAGDKTDLSFIDVPEFQDRAIAYVPILPVLDNYVYPSDVTAGFDELIYVVDQGTEEIISLDKAGNELGRLKVPGVKSVVQDRKLDLLAIGTKDTTIQGDDYSLTAIYRINQRGGTYGLANAKITNTIVHPFYFKTSFATSDAEVQFNGIGILGDNFFSVTRTGPRNNTSQFGGPDDAILQFSSDDQYITPVSVTTNIGFFTDYFKEPSGIATLAQPPQNFNITLSRDFVFTSLSPTSALKVQLIRFYQTAFGSSYEVEDLIAGDTSQADRFLYEPNRFDQPVALTIAGDETSYLFVVDAVRDSVYQFTLTGLEGVQPPAGATSRKNVIASFGGTGQELDQFNDPRGVAFLDNILYVADAGNGRVLRYQLTTDFD